MPPIFVNTDTVTGSPIENRIDVGTIRCEKATKLVNVHMPLYLKPTGAGHASREPFAISADTVELSVGRDESNDLRVMEAAVSARHARLEVLSESSIEVVDCESSHGTFVNDERISTKTATTGDRIRFATAEFELASSSNGGIPSSSKSALETRSVPPVSDLRDLEGTIADLHAKLSERDAEIERLRDLLAQVEADRDETPEAPVRTTGEVIIQELEREVEDKKLELKNVTSDLETLRLELEEEVRKAQRLSRRNTSTGDTGKISLSKVPLDSEQEVYRSLIGRIELFDQMIDGYRRSRKFSEIADELHGFREKLAAILSENGVEPFELDIGTSLNPRHRKEVQILERKGWGTRKYIERQFGPGEVSQIVRPGYRIGSDNRIAILRKVEVVIKEAEG